jgi:pimeloyl-ACP methyl ester carboxylesterase
MARPRQVLFIQGGGAGAHDEWDDKLVESLRRELGGGYEVRYPRMPDEGDPGYARWSAAIRREMADLDDGARLPPGVRVHVFHGLQDENVPPSHAGLYAVAIPQAQVRQLPGRDHQLNNDLSEVAEAIRIGRPRPVSHK